MQKTITDSYLGIIEYSDDLDMYEGKIKLENGEQLEFSFDVDDNLEKIVDITRNVVKTISTRNSQFKEYIAEQLLDLYNDDWSEEETIDKKEFINRISLESVTIYDDNSPEIYYQDGDLFAGHYIALSLNSEGKLGEPYLAG